MKNLFCLPFCFALLMCIYSCSDQSSTEILDDEINLELRGASCSDLTITGAWVNEHPCPGSGCAWKVTGPWGMKIIQDGIELINPQGVYGKSTTFLVSICNGAPSTTIECLLYGDTFCLKALNCDENEFACDSSLAEVELIEGSGCCTYTIDPVPGLLPMVNGQFLVKNIVDGLYHVTVCQGDELIVDLANSQGAVQCFFTAFWLLRRRNIFCKGLPYL